MTSILCVRPLQAGERKMNIRLQRNLALFDLIAEIGVESRAGVAVEWRKFFSG